uniref:Group II intron reverse transcriptase maturase protein n=1 Tax=Laurencia obtusa TaxID=137763 RepID=UPI0028D4C5B8|nr:Group II intron reverse transcriptase maturase protein [Laurencia obtusa]WMP12886.1 Group II intron reverse transcriptase maturase protein [Laurencia obtusa]
MVQKQIYISAKKHNIYYVYELQKYLINSNEAKLIIIKDIIDRTDISHIYSKNSYLFRVRSQIYKAVEVAFYKYLLFSTNLSTLNVEVKNKLLYLSISPVYKAKLKGRLFKSLVDDNCYKSYSIHGVSDMFNRCNNIPFNDNFIQIIVNKLQSSKTISRLIINLLYSGYIDSLFTTSNINFQQCLISKPNKVKNLFISSYSLIDLISNILFLDKSWFFFKTQLKKNNTKNFKRSVYKSIISHENDIRLGISDKINFFIYDKIHHKFRLIKRLNYRNKFTDNLLKIYLTYCKESQKFLSFKLVKKCHKFINILLYTYQKRTNNFNDIKKFINTNYLVNLYLNYYNIMNFSSF